MEQFWRLGPGRSILATFFRSARARARVILAAILLLIGIIFPQRRLVMAAAPAGRAAERIVALNGDVAEIIYALGLGGKVVGTDLSATYPPAAARLHNIGYQRQLNAEAILALRPTIIIGTPDAGPPSVITQLRGSGVRVVILKSSDTMISTSLHRAVQTKIAEIASALGVTATGRRLARTVTTQIARAEALAKHARTKPRVIFLLAEAQANTYLIAGKGSGISAMITAAGGIDAGAASGIYGYIPLTPEALVKARPAILLVFKSSVESVGGLAGLLKLPGVPLTPAGQTKHIVVYEDDFLGNIGPRTGQALNRLVHDFHPELK
ncbi:MAG TPA: ABC transporter substrate-binding protein [Chloroflexota bacterium]